MDSAFSREFESYRKDDTASSSAGSSTVRWQYDVFLSFRGIDTRKSITAELHDLLNKRGVKTFMDETVLEVGHAISSSPLTAIEKSKFAIVVLSTNYASSPWCLKELTKICKCMEDNKILPLFYGVDPSDVHQKKSFEAALTAHKDSGRYSSEEVQQWRHDLKKVASFSGWHTHNNKTDRSLIEMIVDIVSSKVFPTVTDSTGDFVKFDATKQFLNEVMNELKHEVTIIGVYGMAGVGKTAMVKYVGAEARESRLFDRVIMAVLSQNPDLIEIQETLAGLLGLTLGLKSEIGRAHRLDYEPKKDLDNP